VAAAEATVRGNLQADLIDHVFRYGRREQIPVVGDWTGDGIKNIVCSDGRWYLIGRDGRWSRT